MFVNWRQVYAWITLRIPGFTIVLADRLLNMVKGFAYWKKTKTVALKHVRKYELDKTCFVRDAAYANSKNLAKKNVAD